MATPHHIDTEHDIDRATIHRISTLLASLGLKPEFTEDDKGALVVTTDGNSGRLSCRAENGVAGIQLAVCTSKTDLAMALLSQEAYPGDLHIEPWVPPGDVLYGVTFGRADIDTQGFLPSIAACVPLITRAREGSMQSDEAQRGLQSPAHMDTIATIAQAWARNLPDTSIMALVSSLESANPEIFRYPGPAIDATVLRVAKLTAVRKWLAWQLGLEKQEPPPLQTTLSLQEDRDPTRLTIDFLRDVVKDIESKDPDFFNRHAVDGILPTPQEKMESVREVLAEEKFGTPGTQPGSL